MFIFEKSGCFFLSGMFWQIPDLYKKNINLQKMLANTNLNMYCFTKKIVPTWGFCNKKIIEANKKIKKIASLGLYIVECSNVSANTPNSIIAYKFNDNLFGFIVFLNGTICPDDGEFVSDLESIRINIVKKFRKYDLKDLYLPFDVAIELFNFFERLSISMSINTELSLKILNTATIKELHEFKTFIKGSFELRKYENLFGEISSKDKIKLVSSLVTEALFLEKLRTLRASNDDLFILPENIFIAENTSDEIYWTDKQLKSNYRKAILNDITSFKSDIVKLSIAVILIAISIYWFYYNKFSNYGQAVNIVEIPKAIPVDPFLLISNCLINNDKYFSHIEGLTLNELRCDSLGYTLTFKYDNKFEKKDLIQLVGNPNVIFNNGVAKYHFNFNLVSQSHIVLIKSKAISYLEEFARSYDIQISIQPNIYIINSILSPVYLYQKKGFIFGNLSEINMKLNEQNGTYVWNIKGTF